MKLKKRNRAGRALLALLFTLVIAAAPVSAAASPAGDVSGAAASLGDWILGTDFGVVSGSIDTDNQCVTLLLSPERLSSLSPQDDADIRTAIDDILVFYALADAAGAYDIRYAAENGTAAAETPRAEPDATPEPETASAANLIFIHHSCGENWLNDGLCQALNDNGYHVADIYYGWREYGDHTDTADWPMWFTDEVMGPVYRELNAMTAQNAIPPAAGENGIVMFKSCFPNSDVGTGMEDETAVYESLLPYFSEHPDKLFILVTPPPMIRISHPAVTRALCDWLCDRDTGWLSRLTTGNVFVFDFYNVLTHPDAHHRFLNGQEEHTSVEGADTLYYDSGGDDHPDREGNRKAAQEFIGLLNYWYQCFSAAQAQ
jgi:hypothetical protein